MSPNIYTYLALIWAVALQAVPGIAWFFGETCSPEYTAFNVSRLNKGLDAHLFGQHLVQQYLPKLIKNHLKSPQKALTIALHGPTGTGKTFVSKLITDHVFQLGDRSSYVHRFTTLNFPKEDEVNVRRLRNNLKSWIMGNVSRCGASMFIFEEIDKMPHGVLEEIAPFLEHYGQIGGQDYRRTIFLMTTNHGSKPISNILRKHYDNGGARRDLTAKDFDSVLGAAAFNNDGGLKNSRLITKALIDLHLPFLPMEREHVKQCISAQVSKLGDCTLSEAQMNSVMKEVHYYALGNDSTSDQLFSRFGCKQAEVAVKAECG